MAEDWKSQAMRSRVTQQIAEALRHSTAPNNNKSPQGLEMEIFKRSTKKEEYLSYLNRILNHFGASKAPDANQQQQQTSQNPQSVPQTNMTGMTSSSQSNPHLAAMLTGQSTPPMQNQLQQNAQQQQMQQMSGQMGQQPQQQQLGQNQMGQGNQMNNPQQMGSVGQMQGGMGQPNTQIGQGQMVGHNNQGMGGMGGMGQTMTMGNISVSHNQAMGMGTQPNQMGQNAGQPTQMGMARMGGNNQVIGQMTMVGQNASNIGLAGNQVLSNTNPGMMRTNQGMVASGMNTGMGMPTQPGDMGWQGGAGPHRIGGMTGMGPMPTGMPNKMGQIPMQMGRNAPVSGCPTNMQPCMPPTGYVTSSTAGIPRQNLPASVSIASISNMGQQHNTQQQQPNPAAPPQLMASQPPAFISPSPTSNPVLSPANRGMVNAPSPSQGMVNTPGGPAMQASPAAASQVEDRAYLEKVKKLQKYIDPLKTLLTKYDSETNKMQEAAKIRRLLEILQNPNRRTPMETLERCEKVLEKVGVITDPPVHKESAVEVLMEGVRAALSSANPGHVFHKTISPALEKLNGCAIPTPSFKKRKRSDSLSEQQQSNSSLAGHGKISYIIQGEVARLPPRFKVNLDSQQPTGSDDLILLCHIDDTNLPCVPPITLTVPEKYPELAPIATLSALEYSATEFLKRVRDVFERRQKHLPLCTSITMLLDSWEMSIRHACSPNLAKNPDARGPIAAIMELCEVK